MQVIAGLILLYLQLQLQILLIVFCFLASGGIIFYWLSCFNGRYEDAFNRFVDEINALSGYQWWEGSVHSILILVAFPLAWSWQQWRRRKKLQRLREFVRSEYDHSCLRSCRSRALYEGLKVLSSVVFCTCQILEHWSVVHLYCVQGQVGQSFVLCVFMGRRVHVVSSS